MSWRKHDSKKLDTELDFHLDKLTEEKIAAGFSPDEARRQALLDFGGREQAKEELRDVHRLAFIDTLRANLRYALRSMRRSPAFATTVIATLALAIGGNTAVFSALDAILLRPLPYPNADQLVTLSSYHPENAIDSRFLAPARLADWERLNTSFEAITGYYIEDVSETSGDLPERLRRAWVAPRFFETWGVRPAIGRDFTAEDWEPGGPGGAIITYGFWQRRFGADPQVIGKLLALEGRPYSIVGVMPPSFLFRNRDVQVWSPLRTSARFAHDRELTWHTGIGRLKRRADIGQARADMAVVQAQLGEQYPATDAGMEVRIEPLKSASVSRVSGSLWLLFGSVTLLLLIACTNVAAMLIARTAEREREISVRRSLGASRAKIATQLLTESFVLSACGAGLGLLIAAGALGTIRLHASGFPRIDEVTLDWRIALYSLACSVAVTLLCGLLPALRASRSNPAKALAAGGRTQVSARSPLQWFLVGAQAALAVTLLVGAGLFIRSFQELARVERGFDPRNVLTLAISGNWSESGDRPALLARTRRTLDAIRDLPGVVAAATTGKPPGIESQFFSGFDYQVVEGRPHAEGLVSAGTIPISSGYFETLRIPVLAGEPCHQLAGSTVVVNKTFVDRYFGGASPIGYHLRATAKDLTRLPTYRIVGVVADVRDSGLHNEPQPVAHACDVVTPFGMYLVRTRGEPESMAQAIRAKIHEVEPTRAVWSVESLEQRLYASSQQSRLRLLLLSGFAFLALALASVGLYGTLNYFVTLRRREVGLRLALGAKQGGILREFLLRGVGVASVGALLGLGLAAAVSQSMASMLYGVTASDLRANFGAVFAMVLVAATASLIPAARAARVDPMRVLRED